MCCFGINQKTKFLRLCLILFQNFVGSSSKIGEANMESFQFQNPASDYDGMCVHPMTAKALIAPKHPLEAVLKNVSVL